MFFFKNEKKKYFTNLSFKFGRHSLFYNIITAEANLLHEYSNVFCTNAHCSKSEIHLNKKRLNLKDIFHLNDFGINKFIKIKN